MGTTAAPLGTATRAGAASALAAVAGSYADIVLENLATPYPFAAQHVAASDEERRLPRELHPAFHTSFDWHSCVHIHALGVMLLQHGVEAGRDASLRRALGGNLTAEKLAAEAEYLQAHPTWERPYGWAWLVRLAATCSASTDEEIRGWGRALEPAVDVVAALVTEWTAKADWPVRHGLHTNSAFSLGLLLDGFEALGRTEAAAACRHTALAWFGEDTGWPGEWELSGQDFLSAGLSEADLMRRLLPPKAFAGWFEAFLPGLAAGARLLQPLGVSDETDGYMVHLHGLNLSRAGALGRILPALEAGGASEAAEALRPALEPLLDAGLAAVVTREFMASHWLATYAWDALLSVAEPSR
ncbi:DUF2891 family protein [Paenarthrobacter sp. DKR-5]|uniref:DUF2891 family protein n=1 Tax=Paenarthrobacter sp. DKR-5 TaxID=2835535 RepID=UPI001BDD7C0F|nr:DUF2891 family protein [Paenarthrobacter sp. DKR-5]MBT1001920.1 DUF2891 family protein [Paenarthrobacter sp. DKR-5]